MSLLVTSSLVIINKKKLEEGSSALGEEEFIGICASPVKKAVFIKRQCFQVSGAVACNDKQFCPICAKCHV